MLIKPSSSACNLRCRYCFYEDVAANRENRSFGNMSEETLEALVRDAFENMPEKISLAFQGGEPMLRGLPFYKRLIELEKKYSTPGIPIEHSIQTNGTLIDDEWAKFFSKNRFLVGLSLDGTKDLHDLYRKNASGKATWQTVKRALETLQRHGAQVNVLCVITGQAARSAQAVYGSIKKLGVSYIQFIPCLDPIGEERGKRKFSLTPERYENFLKALFDMWYRDWEKGSYTSVRLFDDYVHLLCGLPAGNCATSGKCGQYFVVEGDGSTYPCDFYVLDKWKMGQIGKDTLMDLKKSEKAKRFIAEGEDSPEGCAECRWQKLCTGGCRRDRLLRDGVKVNYYCSAFKNFFEYAHKRLENIAAKEMRTLREMRGAKK